MSPQESPASTGVGREITGVVGGLQTVSTLSTLVAGLAISSGVIYNGAYFATLRLDLFGALTIDDHIRSALGWLPPIAIGLSIWVAGNWFSYQVGVARGENPEELRMVGIAPAWLARTWFVALAAFFVTAVATSYQVVSPTWGLIALIVFGAYLASLTIRAVLRRYPVHYFDAMDLLAMTAAVAAGAAGFGWFDARGPGPRASVYLKDGHEITEVAYQRTIGSSVLLRDLRQGARSFVLIPSAEILRLEMRPD